MDRPNKAPKANSRRLTQPPPKPNLSDETIREFYRDYVQAAVEMESKAGSLKALLARYKNAGGNPKDLGQARKMKSLDPGEMTENLKRIIRVVNTVSHQPIIGQFDLFPVDVHPEERSQESVEKHSAWEAKQAGIVAGKAGHPLDGNPYLQGGLSHAQFVSGWRDGQAELAKGLATGVAVASDARKRRNIGALKPDNASTVAAALANDNDPKGDVGEVEEIEPFETLDEETETIGTA